MTPERELDKALAVLFGLRVVADDWPCGHEPECGCYEAETHFRGDETPETVECEERGPVFTNDPEGEDWFEADPDYLYMRYANVIPVPFYSTTDEGMGMVIDEMDRLGYKHFGLWWNKEVAYADNQWMAYFDGRYGYGKTRAEAVAKAARQALEANQG